MVVSLVEDIKCFVIGFDFRDFALQLELMVREYFLIVRVFVVLI